MQSFGMSLILYLAAFHVSDALVIAKQEPIVYAGAEAPAVLSALATSAGGEDEDAVDPDTLVRPNAGNGVDVVQFGLRAMNFYGTDLKHHTFSLDMVMAVRWTDPRVIALIPDGLEKLSMSWKQADKLIWMPGVVVSNRDIEKYEIISASVTLYKTGEVRRVERANTRVMKKFALEGYPFDTQDLAVNIASSKYMLDEVRLEPDGETSGIEENNWGLYILDSWHVAAYEQSDGELKKIRGSLTITVGRSLDKYSQNHLLPASIVLMVSWLVFYFPFANPFIVARLALSILALLTFTQLIVKSSGELPGAAPFNWNDLLNQQIQIMMFFTIVLNILTEVCYHQFHDEKVARGMNNEAKVLLPVMSMINIALIGFGGKYHLMSLETCIVMTKVVLFVLVGGYAAWNVYCAWRPEVPKLLADAMEKLTPRTPREVDENGKEVPPSFAELKLAELVIATAVVKSNDDADCDM